MICLVRVEIYIYTPVFQGPHFFVTCIRSVCMHAHVSLNMQILFSTSPSFSHLDSILTIILEVSIPYNIIKIS